MLKEASKQKIIKRIQKLIENSDISIDISYSLQEKDGIYQCVIKYKSNGKWKPFWTTTEITTTRGNQRLASKIAKEIADLFQNMVMENYNKKENQEMNIADMQKLVQLNTTNYDTNIKTKADWDFYEYMKYWLYHIAKSYVAKNTFKGYKRNVENYLKEYFSMEKHKKTVKEITADDLEEFYDFLRVEKDLKNATIDHYQDNISSAYKSLLRKKLVKYNPTDLVNPIKVETIEVSTYTKPEILKLFQALEGDTIELPSKFASYYGLRRSEILGLRIEAFDFEKNYFTINHVALEDDDKDAEEKIYFLDKTKSKKGYRTFPIFRGIREDILNKIDRIEKCKEFFGDSYNHKFDGYLFVHDNGNFIAPNYFTKRFNKIIERNDLKKITPHGLRHSIATLLHIEGVDIRDLQDWLGHQSVSSTNRYTRSDYQKQLETGKAVEKIFGNKEAIKKAIPKRVYGQKKNIYVTT